MDTKIIRLQHLIETLTIRNNVWDCHHDQMDCSIIAYIDGDGAGYIDYTIFENEIHVNNIFVNEAFRRRGIASKLYRELQAIAAKDNMKINNGYSTDDGTAFLANIKEESRQDAKDRIAKDNDEMAHDEFQTKDLMLFHPIISPASEEETD